MRSFSVLLIVFVWLSISSCSDDDPSPDTRESIVGNYTIQNMQGSIIQADFFITDPVLFEVSYDASLNDNEVYLDVEPVVEAILTELTYLQFLTNNIIQANVTDKNRIAVIDDTKYTLKDSEFTVVSTSPQGTDFLICQLKLTGNIGDGDIDLAYEFLVYGENITYIGEGSGTGSIQ
jgi:hypothetical protein